MLRPGVAATTAESTVSVDVPSPASPPPQPPVNYNPLIAMSGGAKMVVGAGILVGTLATAWMTVSSATSPALFNGQQLTATQVGTFVLILSSLAIWLLVHLLAVKNAFATGSSIAVALRSLVSDEANAALHACAELALYMAVFFLCDRTNVLPRSKKHYNKDFFWFIWALLCIAALFTLKKAKNPNAEKPGAAATAPDDKENKAVAAAPDFHVKLLQRDQTEEWKGWMQVMFLWYHYFEAKDLYNAIRLYIAAYVWMTGFGNFSYYYVKQDFSLERFLQMQWRLNFLVIIVCMTLSNEYMLYYICMLHTMFTVMIYAGLGIVPHINQTFWGVCVKFGALTAASFIMWDIPGVFNVLWAPFSWLVGYHDPYNVKRDVLHEWQFRSHLDHYVWIFGMFCAYNHPRLDGWLVSLDNMHNRTASYGIKFAVLAACLALGYVYVDNIYNLGKKEYNALHPYTSWIPIALYCIVRNLFSTFRQYHMHLFEYLGKVTLETYIAQFHIWMGTTGINGAPKVLLRVFPEGWPFMNFLAMSALTLWVSMRLFHVTNALKSVVLPSRTSRPVLVRNVIWLGFGTAATLLFGALIRTLVIRTSGDAE